jgi:hypothetical protein
MWSSLDLFSDFPSATNNVRPTRGGAAAVAHRRHGLEVEDEVLLKDLIEIFLFLRSASYCLLFLLMPESFCKK